MKVRHGFVSNSSSSSFIIGHGEIIDMRKFKKYLLDNNIVLDQWCIEVQKKGKPRTALMGDTIHGGNETKVSLPLPILKGKVNAFIVGIRHDEGDCAFTTYDEDGEYGDLDYGPAFKETFYSEKEQKIISLLRNKKLIKNGYVQFGAERNG